ncbi:hypothetical protein SARC_03229 [Sphaeroforma arctica JP610]|uniref:Uncharacterized protein n=1 Tax=Sphaeroforma arctica JP610 TaxID=667725 RepID=A0A0L0G6Q0_9EUKA|nr:hypothetical protein SARC_03229 [Sphaeroforma arctica JP610]KNC84556.1 hypothetical protein SARC_03229 [Sphaeroforma arctica JP610]|eukprot:XP_014158458.1 hypothetical protein SARC_03229 [Sphaeroforma arctica JP610]
MVLRDSLYNSVCIVGHLGYVRPIGTRTVWTLDCLDSGLSGLWTVWSLDCLDCLDSELSGLRTVWTVWTLDCLDCLDSELSGGCV